MCEYKEGEGRKGKERVGEKGRNEVGQLASKKWVRMEDLGRVDEAFFADVHSQI